MAKIETRAALIKWSARKLSDLGLDYITLATMTEFLDALDAAGLVICPKEPTTEMVEALLSGLGPVMADDLALAIDASPYRRE